MVHISLTSVKRRLKPLAPHLYCGPIEAAANIQIGTCSPNFLIHESIERFDGFHAELLKEPIQWEDGYIIPPTKPGLGVELDEEVATALDTSSGLARSSFLFRAISSW